MKTLLLSLLITISVGCVYDPPAPRMLQIKNESAYDIYVYMTDADSIPLKPELVVNYNPLSRRSLDPAYFIGKCDSGYLSMRGVKRNFPFQGDTARLFFMRKETIENYSWEDVYTYQLYESKVTLTRKEIKRMAWLYIYNPNTIDNMSD